MNTNEHIPNVYYLSSKKIKTKFLYKYTHLSFGYLKKRLLSTIIKRTHEEFEFFTILCQLFQFIYYRHKRELKRLASCCLSILIDG